MTEHIKWTVYCSACEAPLKGAFAGNCEADACGAILCESCLDDDECPICGYKRRAAFENAETNNENDETTD